ncbi:MAG: helix-turn-helix transcriptional regulator [Gammaproteobacteria bacterium]|nr:helix-turn-helix transcriptional regulator [Gammaproteobacteria bacterium]
MPDVRQTCPIEVAASAISGKWKSVIFYRLLEGPIRFNVLLRSIPDITRRMLTLQLKELEGCGLVHREVYRQVPPKVEYSLTELGRSFEPNLQLLKQWGEYYLQERNKKL